MKYVLEVNTWGEWQVEESFSTLEQANIWGQNNFEQNEWRILANGEVLYLYDPLGAFAKAAQADINRFKQTVLMRDRFAAQKEQRITRLAEESRMSQELARHRNAPFGWDFDDEIAPHIEDYLARQQRRDTIPAVDWKREGF